MAAAATDDPKRQDEASASRSAALAAPPLPPCFIHQKTKENNGVNPGKNDLDERSVMQFKYDPVDGHCYFLRVQIAFNILEIAG